MIKLIRDDFNILCNNNIREFILDSEEEVASLPSSAPSSTAMVVAEGLPIYMVNASGEWVKVI